MSEYYEPSFLGQLLQSAGNPTMSAEKVFELEGLFNFYKKEKVQVGRTVIEVEMGMLYGHYTVRPVFEGSKEKILNYKKGSYDFINLRTIGQTVLFTDFNGQEPYNRQSVYYVPYSFDMLHKVRETLNYREYQYTDSYENNISYGVWGFEFNNFWNYVRFGICIDNDNLEEFLSAFRKILDK